MATVQEAIRRLTIQSVITGAQEVIDKLRGVERAQEGVAKGAERSERATQSMEKRLESINRQYDRDYRAQQNLAKVQRDLDMARAQGLVTAQRQAELMRLAEQHHRGAANGVAVHARALQGLNTQAMAMSASLGAVGSTLTALGPGGIALAAVLGTMTAIIAVMTSSALKFGEFAGNLTDVSESLNVSMAALQGFNKIGAEVGLSSQKIEAGLSRVTIQLAEMRKAEGPLYEAIVRANPVIAEQMVRTRDTEKQITLLAKAYGMADEQLKKLIISAAAGARNVSFGRFLTAVNELGGVRGAVRAVDPRDVIPDDLLKRLDALSDTIGYVFATAKNNILRTFAEPLLEVIKEIGERFLQWTRTLRDWKTPEELKAFFRDTFSTAAENAKSFVGFLRDALGVINSIITAIQTARNLLPSLPSPAAVGRYAIGGLPRTAADFEAQYNPETVRARGVAPAAANFAVEGGFRKATLEEEIRLLEMSVAWHKRLIAEATDPGAIRRFTTAYEVATTALAAKRKEMLPAEEERKDAGPTREAIASMERQRLGMLGDAATMTEQNWSKQLDLNAALEKAPHLTREHQRAMEAVRQAFDIQIGQAKIALGIATEQEIIDLKLLQTRMALARAGITDAQKIAQAEALAVKSAKEQNDALEVRRSLYPQLTRYAIDAADAQKQIDQFALSAFNSFESAFADVITGTKSVSAAFKDMTNAILRDLARLLIRQTITGPLANAITAGLGGIIGATPTAAVTGAINLNAGVNNAVGGYLAGIGHTGGMIGMGGQQRYVHPAYFENAPRYHSGTPNLQAGEVPFIGMKGEEIGWPSQLAAKYGGKTEVHVHNYSGAKVEERESENGRRVDIVIGEAVAGAVSAPGGSANRALARMGARQPTVRR